jgi:hypothetical protein
VIYCASRLATQPGWKFFTSTRRLAMAKFAGVHPRPKAEIF